MEAATVFQVAKLRGVRAGCVLGVSDVGRERIEQAALEELGIRIGEVAWSALSR